MKILHKLIFILLVCVSGLVLRRALYKEHFTSLELHLIPQHIPASSPPSFESTIPRKVFMTWTTRELPPDMYKTILNNSKENPEFDFYIYSEDECAEFISSNFDIEVVNTYKSLKPSAYKSDFWRYCVVYIHGGIYLDVKFKCMVPLNDIIKQNKTMYVKDLVDNNVANGVLIAQPREPIFYKCIYKIVENVKAKFYGVCSLHPTGPRLIGDILHEHSMQSAITMMGIVVDTPHSNKLRIVYKDDPTKILFDPYDTYRLEQRALNTNDGVKYYVDMWKERDIYA